MENLDYLGCPKVFKPLNNSDSDWDCSNYPYRNKKTFHCAEKKAYAYGTWTLDFLIIFVFSNCICDRFVINYFYFTPFEIRESHIRVTKVAHKVLMTDHTENGLTLGNFVFDDNNQERQSWKCFGQT